MKKLYLEFIRGAAAITVLLYHFFELHSLSNHTGHFYFGNWGTDAVIIFFILSGIVINISQTNNPKQRWQFMVNRVLRLYPQLIAGLLLGLLVLFLTQSTFPSVGTIAGNFLMVSAVKGYMINIVPCIESNSPLWSLSYEIVFYLLFALTIGKFQKRSIKYWLALSLAIMPLYYLQIGPTVLKHFVAVIAYSSIWLIGYYIYEYRHYFYADKYAALFSAGALPLISRMHIFALYYDPLKYVIFAIFAAPFFIYCLQSPQKGRKIQWEFLALPYCLVVYIVFKQPYLTFTSFAAYSVLPVLLMFAGFIIGVLKLKQLVASYIERTGGVFGKYSYSIYVIHYPVLFFCASFFHGAAINLAISLPCIALMAYGMETYLQPAVINYYKSLKAISLKTAPGDLITWPAYNSKFIFVKRIILPLIAAVSWLLLVPFKK